MPQLGNSVESVILLGWHIAVGERVRQGQPLCEIETDKAALDVESTADGILLARFYEAGDEVSVLRKIAAVGAADESIDAIQSSSDPDSPSLTLPGGGRGAGLDSPSQTNQAGNQARGTLPISPRARKLAQRKSLDIDGIRGTGPGGRIIERDIHAALEARVRVSPLAKAMLDSGDYQIAPSQSESRRIKKADLQATDSADAVTAIPLAGARKVIARRMLESLQSTAQLTLHSSADARKLQAYRRRLKASDESLGLRHASLNDLLLFAVARTLPAYPALNATFEDEVIKRHREVHLGMAVDTERALLVPVIRRANALSLRALADEARRLTRAALDGALTADDMAGGSFTVTNLGAFGIERFTPILNPPQVGILGVGNINLKPLPIDGEVSFVPHIGLSLTVDHQIVDGAPAARFLAALATNIADIDLLLAT